MNYNKYTDSEISWVGRIPSHWEKSKFKHNFTFSKSTNTSKNPTILSLTLQGIKIRDISTNEGQIASSYDNYTKVYKRDIVLNPMDLISGFVDCSTVEGVISPAYYTLKPNKDIIPEYYKYYLQKHYYERIFFPFAEGVSVDHRWTLKKEDFLNFYLIKPPIEEQKAIANFLDEKTVKIDEIIEQNKKLIELLEEKRISLINQIVTKGLNPNVPMKDSNVDWIGKIPKQWDTYKLKHVIDEFIAGGTPKSSNDEYWDENNMGIPWVAIGDMTDNEYIDFTAKSLTMKGLLSKNLRILKKGTLLYSIFASLGKTSILNIDATTNQAILGLIVSNRIDTSYLRYYLEALRTTISSYSNENTQQNLNSNIVKNMDIAMPKSLDEQKQIVNYLDKKISKINLSISKIKENIGLLEEYKISLIHHVVTGKIDVRGEEI